MRQHNWIGATTVRGSVMDNDVKVVLTTSGRYKDGKQRYNINFTFYHDSYKKFTSNKLAIYDVDKDSGRIWFAQGNSANGLRISGKPDSTSKVFKSTVYEKDLDFWSGTEGGYDLLYDNLDKNYYIDLSRKK